MGVEKLKLGEEQEYGEARGGGGDSSEGRMYEKVLWKPIILYPN